MRRKCFAAVLLVVTASAAGAQSVAGTYRLAICSAPCDQEGAAIVARGHLVLFESWTDVETLPDSIRRPLQDWSRWLLLRSGPPNACFSIAQRQSMIDGKEFYAGIIPKGLTRWVHVDATVRVRLYQSADAFYRLEGTMTNGTYSGRGVQGICCQYPPPPETWFVAERVGPADAAVCH